MNFLLSIVLNFAATFVAMMFFPWWVTVVNSFVICGFLNKDNALLAFFAGLMSVFLLWGGYAFMLSSGNEHILAEQVASLFYLKSGISMILVSGALGAILGGFAGMSGSWLFQIFKKNKASNKYWSE